jgi:hypothetical protein
MIQSVLAVTTAGAFAGPYSLGVDDPLNAHDAPVPGFIGPHGIGKARLDDGMGNITHPDNHVNPLFFAWASGTQDYERSDSDAGFNDPTFALGPVTGDHFDVVSLGDMSAAQIANGDPQGRITLTFDQPIRNRSGADFVVFENGFVPGFNLGGAGAGGVLAELAHVEVSADGVNFQRFPSSSLTPASVGFYGSIHPTQVFGLAGKHVNAYGNSWGTPFDIGALGLSQITHIRIVDVPGDGSFEDSSSLPIYDPWQTGGSGGFDLEAIGAIAVDMSFVNWPSLQQLPQGQGAETDDPDQDGIPNLLEYAFGLMPWIVDPPSSGWDYEIILEAGMSYFEITTLRDERSSDLRREVQFSTDMISWQSIAESVAGSSFQAVNAHPVLVASESASNIASVGVLRRDRIRDLNPIPPAGQGFYRLKVTKLTP